MNKSNFSAIELEMIAKVCHEANRSYCESQSDFTQPPFAVLAPSIKARIMDGVVFHIENPDATPEQSHENWLKFKVADGWKYGEKKDTVARTHPCMKPYKEQSHENWLKFKVADGWKYGEKKDTVARTHPCMKPYKELPAEQQMKDHIFQSIVLTMANQILVNKGFAEPEPNIKDIETKEFVELEIVIDGAMAVAKELEGKLLDSDCNDPDFQDKDMPQVSEEHYGNVYLDKTVDLKLKVQQIYAMLRAMSQSFRIPEF